MNRINSKTQILADCLSGLKVQMGFTPLFPVRLLCKKKDLKIKPLPLPASRVDERRRRSVIKSNRDMDNLFAVVRRQEGCLLVARGPENSIPTGLCVCVCVCVCVRLCVCVCVCVCVCESGLFDLRVNLFQSIREVVGGRQPPADLSLSLLNHTPVKHPIILSAGGRAAPSLRNVVGIDLKGNVYRRVICV